MSADVLREAAKLMRERAEAATPGPWEADTSEVYGACHEWIGETCVLGNENLTAANSAHIASWHPAVALAAALLLEAMAVWADDWAPGEPPSVAPYQSALAFANAYLGRSS